MANPSGMQSVVLEQFLGLVSNIGPESCPEGSSPLNWDVSYITGSVFTRPGLVSVYTTGMGWGFDWGANWGGSTLTNNFVYVKTFALTSGQYYTLALGGGTLWVENVNSTPGVLFPLEPTNLGSYAASTTQSDFEYICFSNLLNGTEIPRQYNPQPASGGYTLDRISQVGPGAPPTFQINLTQATSTITITSWAGVGNTVTFQAVNTLTAGTLVKLLNFTTSTFFNNQVFSVLSTGLTGAQFQIAFAGFSGGSDTGQAIPQYSYDIASISQPAQYVNPEHAGNFDALLWSTGPGSKSAGNVITVYYVNAFKFPQDSVLKNAFNTGLPVYVYINGAAFGNGTSLVTSVGQGIPPGGSYVRWYFTIQTTSSNFQFHGGGQTPGTYQMSLATLVSKEAIPGLSVGDQITITGATPSGWNASWTITATLLSGTYNITQTSLAATGIATYSWSWAGSTTAIAPKAGQLVTVINTLNGNGVFNVAEAVIATVTGGPSSGTFTINNFPAQTIAAAFETGQASTAGTTFQFDPGATTLGSNVSPIYGNDNGSGLITIAGQNNQVGAGTRQAVCFFETRNGLKTACSAPITFTTSNNSSFILATNIPIGPPDVIRRWIAFTTAGQNSIPGPNFYTIDAPVSYTINNQTLRYTATYVDDNVTTTAKFTFTDAILIAGEEIDVQGNNLFNQIELGSVGWNIAYAGRMFYGLEQNKVLNFTNMSFDGGYVPNLTGANTPLGWGIDPASNSSAGSPVTITAFSITSNVVTFTAANTFVTGQEVVIQGLSTGTYLNNQTLAVSSTGLTTSSFQVSFVHADVGSTADNGTATPIFVGGSLVTSPVFGNAYYIQNTVGTTQSILGMILQNAFNDAYNVPIILPNTLYSVRVTASIPSALTTGTLVVDLADSNSGLVSGSGVLSGYGLTYGSFTVPFSSMSITPTIFSGTILSTAFSVGVPPGLVLRVWAQNIGYGADVLVDRVELYPTAQPLLATNIRVSYVDNFEAFDAVTGNIGLAEHNTQTCYGAVELHDQLYFLQSASMQSTQDIPGTEPSGPNGGWAVHEVSNRVGTCGIHAYDYGEEWILTACRNGLFGFNGGQPIRIDFQQKEIWDLINWRYGYTLVVRNDIINRRITVNVPLPTPNKWLPLAPVNTNPTTPNVMLMWNWEGLNDFQELVGGQVLHTTMFGTLAAVDMRLKFSLWQIPSPYAAMVTTSDLISQQLLVCDGGTARTISQLDPDALSDNGTAINGTYFTYGFVDSAKATQNPLLGFHRKAFSMAQFLLTGSGTATMTAYPNYFYTPSTLVFNQYAYTLPGITLQEQPIDDLERPLAISGNRVYVSFSTNAVGAAMNLSKLIMVGSIDQYAQSNPNSG